MEQYQIKELVAHLSKSHSFENTKLVETHSAWVILSEEFAYKIKKPIKLFFLDYTTLKNRKYFCEKEIVLNSRFSPELYLKVVPLSTNSQNQIVLGAGENIIDYAIQMKRIPEDCLMSEIIKRNSLTKSNIEDIAKAIFDFHDSAEKIHDQPCGTGKVIIGNLIDDAECAKDLVSLHNREAAKMIEEIIQAYKNFLKDHDSVFDQRQKNGFIRDCHGDLRSANIFLADRPYLFDCIEFKDDWRKIDVIVDVASLVADLKSINKEELAFAFTNEYKKLSEDPGIDTILPLYTCHWSLVLAQVALHQLKLVDEAKEEQKKLLTRANQCIHNAYQIMESGF